MLENLNEQIFSAHRNSTFRLCAPNSEPLDLELIDVVKKDMSPRMESFSLIFRGPGEHCLPQKMHTLDHEKLGRLALFLVPIGMDAKGLCYEAVFNRIRRENQ